MLTKEGAHLCTTNLQFGFKQGSSTSLCTTMVQETISCYVHNGSNVYGLMLDASKAFDRVNYSKLFRILLEKKICPLYCKLLLNMHFNQKLRVRWESIHSHNFNFTNNVIQGGVISPILFCIYMDGLLHELENNGVGCYMGAVFVGATGYADDLKLLTPSVNALNILVNICKNYAAKYDVMFNANKRLLIIYKCTRRKPRDPNIYINNVKIPRVNEVIHLGHNISVKIFLNSMHQNVLLILTANVICTLLILNMLTLILEMCCSINTALHSMAVKFTPCLTVVWKKFILHGE